MRFGLWTSVALLAAAMPVILAAQTPAAGSGQKPAPPQPRPPLTLTTTAFPDGAQIPVKYHAGR